MITARSSGSFPSHVQSAKQCAAEDFAIAMGVLRECPYHGQPFKARKRLVRGALAAAVIDPREPVAQLFRGNARALLAAVRRVTRRYGERCKFCAAADQPDLE